MKKPLFPKKVKWSPDLVWKNYNGAREVLLDDVKAHLLHQFVQARRGFVYIIENRLFPGHFKVGRTTKNPFVRAKTLKTAGVLGDFDLIWIHEYCDAVWAEAKVHIILNDYRVDREWFVVNIETAKMAMQKITDEENKMMEWLNRDGLLKESFKAWVSSLDLSSVIDSEL